MLDKIVFINKKKNKFSPILVFYYADINNLEEVDIVYYNLKSGGQVVDNSAVTTTKQIDIKRS